VPYFVYQIHSPKNLSYLDKKSSYQEAKSLVRELRAKQTNDDESTIRMIFAKTNAEAEKLLSAPKDERVIGED
jgi:hypothetical protein